MTRDRTHMVAAWGELGRGGGVAGLEYAGGAEEGVRGWSRGWAGRGYSGW